MSRRTLLILLMFLGTLAGIGEVFSQHYFGIRGGYGSGSSRFYPPEEMGVVWGLYSGGVSWKYYSPEKAMGGIEVDMMLMQQGYKRYNINENYFPGITDTTLHLTRKVNTVMVPLIWQPHVYMFQRKVRIFLNAGLTISYNISSDAWIDSDLEGRIEHLGYEMIPTRDNRWGYGLMGGGGIGFTAGRIETLVEARYYIGYADILKNTNKYRANPRRSPLDGLQLQVGIYYRFGNRGILSPPSAKVAEKLRESEQRRFERQARRTEPEGVEPEELPEDDPDPGTNPDPESMDLRDDSGVPVTDLTPFTEEESVPHPAQVPDQTNN